METTNMEEQATANQVVMMKLNELLQIFEDKAGADILTLVAPMHPPVDELLKKAVESRANKRKKLLVLIETFGGSIAPVERIVKVFRRYYDDVEFVVPDKAMSAGTVLVLSGDKIYMDYFSVLGPIDPQVRNENGKYVPANGYLAQYHHLQKRSQNASLTEAELAVLLKFDQAEIYQYEQEVQLTVALLKEWLVKYKFKDWRQTETRGIAVTAQMKKKRATAIAKKLNESQRWHTHGRGIFKETLEKEVGIKIEDLETVPWKTEYEKYWRLAENCMHTIDANLVIHSPVSKVFLKI